MCTDEKGIRYYLCGRLQGGYTGIAEIQSGTLMILLGIWLLFNDTFQVSAVYKVMSSLGSEVAWSAIFITIGLVQRLCIVFRGRRWVLWAGKPYAVAFNVNWMRRHVILLRGAIWLTLGIGVLQGDIRALATPMYLYFAFTAFRAFFCLKFGKLDT